MGLSLANGLSLFAACVGSGAFDLQPAAVQAAAAAPAESFRKFLLSRLMFLLPLFQENDILDINQIL
jgi:hypothetical protein